MSLSVYRKVSFCQTIKVNAGQNLGLPNKGFYDSLKKYEQIYAGEKIINIQ